MKLENLKAKRNEKGLSQVALGERLYVHQQHISAIERGQNVSRPMAHRLADALGCEVEDLVDPEVMDTLKALRK
jgi:transcriptional regulator with XRE-family HTH domain